MKQVIHYIVCIVFLILYLILTFHCIVKERADTSADISLPDTVYIHDTAYITAPTPTSDMVIGHATAVLERADKRADRVYEVNLF